MLGAIASGQHTLLTLLLFVEPLVSVLAEIMRRYSLILQGWNN